MNRCVRSTRVTSSRVVAMPVNGSHISGKSFAAGGPDVESLADTVAATIADEHAVRKVAVITRHQIVARFPDGTRHVFDEATPRTMRVGDRVRVIAGAAGPTI